MGTLLPRDKYPIGYQGAHSKDSRMKILLLGEEAGARRILNRILGSSWHQLTLHALEAIPDLDLEQYDMALVDGNICDCAQQVRLADWIRETRRRFPHLQVAVMNYVRSPAVAESGKAGGETSRACGVSKSADGAWQMRCRLREIALSETAALLRDAHERQPLEPVTFEYSGSG